jgi:GPH family glycoside/pentoside/hexuronide:cation symporter
MDPLSSTHTTTACRTNEVKRAPTSSQDDSPREHDELLHGSNGNEDDVGTASAPLSQRERVLYSMGSVAFGVKENGFSYWLLNFYNQVLGLSAPRTSMALFIALVFDAAADVMIGWCSDNLRTVWGRRHPLLYASAVPSALLTIGLWNPPEWVVASPDRLFAYLIVFAVLLRFAISLNEIPSAALIAELSSSYDERTSIVSLRYFFGWLGGLGMHVYLQAFLLHESAPGANDAFFDMHGFHRCGLPSQPQPPSTLLPP